MIGRPSPLCWYRLGLGFVLVGLTLATACFRQTDPGKIICGDDDYCPSGYRCQLVPNTGQGRCQSDFPHDASGTTLDTALGDRPAAFDASVDGPLATGGTAGGDAISGQDGATGGESGAAGRPGSGGTAVRDASMGTGGIAATGGMVATGGAAGSITGLGGRLGLGGITSSVTGSGGGAGQSGPVGTGGQGQRTGTGGSSPSPMGGASTGGSVGPSTGGSVGPSTGGSVGPSTGGSVAPSTGGSVAPSTGGSAGPSTGGAGGASAGGSGGTSTGPANLPVPPEGFDAPNTSIPHGTVAVSLDYPTTQYGQQKVTVYTPPGYSTGQEYPVLYLLHGIGGNELSWIGQGGNEGNADNIMDYLYSQAMAVPMIVVMPDGNTKGASDGFGAFTDVLLDDLIPWVEQNYSAANNADSRAISGLSMGGGQTLNIGFPHTELFHYIGPYSAAPNTQSPSQTIADVAVVKQRVKVIYISCGGSDGLISFSQNYHDYLVENNVPHIWQIEQGLDHERTVWNRSLYHFAQRIFAD